MTGILILGAALLGSLAPAMGRADGLKAHIMEVNIGSDRRPVATIKISDGKGKPLELADLDSGRIKLTIAKIQNGKSGETAYHNYMLTRVVGKDYIYKGETKSPVLGETLQPGFDQDGTVVRVRPGLFTYKFAKALPSDYDRNATHVIGGEVTGEKGKYVANPLFEFVPAGAKVKARRTVIETASCNNCHDPLKYHGGTRREANYCALCHTSQLTDPESGESLDFKVFVHKIHQGKLLPSVKAGKPYFIVGSEQQVADYTNLRYPQVVTTEGITKDLRNCKACHGAALNGDNWKTSPATAPCIACHDNVDLKTGKNHPLGPQAEGSCIGCHQPDGPEFGPSIAGAHTFPGWSTQLSGIVFEILRIEGTQPGQNPSVTFSVKNKKAEPVNAAQMDNLRLVIAWPTVDYKVALEEDARKGEPLGNGIYTYRFKYTIPFDAAGSGAIGMQGFKNVNLQKPNGTVIKAVRDVGYNIVKYFPITDREATARRKAVNIENCNVCHATLAMHGEARRNTEFCVMCHNASQTDQDKRKTANGPVPPESVHYKRLIHRIHTGANLGESYIIYGGTPAKPGPIEFGDIRFPGDRRNCTKCHVMGANELPLPAGSLPTLIPQATGSVKAIQPIASACIACHNKETASAHMETLTAANGQESCVVCHGAGREFSVDKVHRR